MDKPVAERPRHREVYTALAGGITCRHHDPLVRQCVFPKLPVQHELIAARLGHLWSAGQLIEKENASAALGQKLRRHPLGLVGEDTRKPPEIDRVQLHCADVKELVAQVSRDLADNLRLADAASSPNVDGYTFADECTKRLIEFARSHRYLPGNWLYWVAVDSRGKSACRCSCMGEAALLDRTCSAEVVRVETN